MKLRSKTFIAFVTLAIIYASVNLIAAPPRTTLQQYHISETSLRLLNSTVVVPVVAIWFVGLYGYQKLRTYTSYVTANKEGERLVELTRGVMLLAWWLPVTSTVSAVLNLFARSHPNFQPAATIIVEYISVLFPLLAFWFLGRACRRLSELSHRRPNQYSVHVMALVLITGSILYGYLLASSQANIWTIYHLPLVLVLLTLAVPNIFTWYLGLLAAFDLHLYTGSVKGIVFRKAWNLVSLGVVWLIIMGILLQYVTAVSAKLGDLSLGWILALVYGILLVMAAGYVFIALGAKKLTRIEEV